MVRHHVPERTGVLVIVAPALDTDPLGHRDLNVVDVTAIPDRLEDAVGEAEDQDVLDGLLAQVMVDAEDLPLRQHLPDLPVEGAGRLEVPAKRLFDDDAPPAPLLGGQSRSTELADDRAEHAGGCGQIIEAVAPRALFVRNPREKGLELLVAARVVEVTPQVMDAPEELVPEGRLDRRCGECVQTAFHLLAKLLGPEVLAGQPDDGEVIGQQSASLQVVQCRDELAPGQIPRGSEDHQRTRVAGSRPAAGR